MAGKNTCQREKFRICLLGDLNMFAAYTVSLALSFKLEFAIDNSVVITSIKVHHEVTACLGSLTPMQVFGQTLEPQS